MFKIFEKKYTESNSVIKPPEFELVRRVYTSMIGLVMEIVLDAEAVPH